MADVTDEIEPGKIDSTDNNKATDTSLTMNNRESSTIIKDDKALKKKLKKERQREKKNKDKEPTEVTSSNDINKLDIETSTGIDDDAKEKSIVGSDEKTIDGSDDDNENNTNIENDDDAESTNIDVTAPSAFIKSSINKMDTTKMVKKIDTFKGKESFKDTNRKSNQLVPDESDGFTSVKKGIKQAPVNFPKTPEGFGNEALSVIEIDNFPLAIDYLTRAIALDRADPRHYINRSYCYLRTGRYAEALDDITFASKHFTDVTELSQAKCRMGQALCGLKNYEHGERAFRESIELMPNCSYAKRELKRVQVQQLIGMGFNERDAVLALAKDPDTMEAMNHLLTIKPPSNNNDFYDSEGSATDDEIFHSDNEECPSNERLLSKILNYDPNVPDKPYIPELLPTNKIIKNLKQQPKAISADRELRVIKTIQSPIKAKPTNQVINEMAIWVGDITAQLTDSMLTKAFGKFGKVTQVWRSPDGGYAFVNFELPTSARKALEERNVNGGYIYVNGNPLPIKPATKKAFKFT